MIEIKKKKKTAGTHGWLSWLSVQLLILSQVIMIPGSWDPARCWALHWAWSLLKILSVTSLSCCLSPWRALSLSLSLSLSLPLKLKKTNFICTCAPLYQPGNSSFSLSSLLPCSYFSSSTLGQGSDEQWGQEKDSYSDFLMRLIPNLIKHKKYTVSSALSTNS